MSKVRNPVNPVDLKTCTPPRDIFTRLGILIYLGFTGILFSSLLWVMKFSGLY